VPTKRVLVLRFRDAHEPLVQTLVLKGVSCVSAYPLSWSKKTWNAQEERMAREVDVVYFHEPHNVKEWAARLPQNEVVAACHDEEVAGAAKALGFRHIFFSKQPDSTSLATTVLQAVEFAKSQEFLGTKVRGRRTE